MSRAELWAWAQKALSASDPTGEMEVKAVDEATHTVTVGPVERPRLVFTEDQQHEAFRQAFAEAHERLGPVVPANRHERRKAAARARKAPSHGKP